MEKYFTTSQKFLEAYFDLTKSTEKDNFTINQIADRANLSRRVFYHYYNSKETFLEEALEYILNEINIILAKDPTLSDDVIAEMLTFLYNNRSIAVDFVTIIPHISLEVTKYITEVVENSSIPNLPKQLEQAYKIPYEYALTVYVSTIDSIIKHWIQNGCQEPPEIIHRYILSIVRI
ncbi:TetR/AcrR family transcriptional regulator [Streptococcus suis]|uniref:TetR/AcrR family transcriptional regulator n=1 Tax=Streptococcus suis TaxID=1307 RepID=UPI000CF74AE9|nr:TetR/AcrR family transcriptional regulator [Streptococcus suis]